MAPCVAGFHIFPSTCTVKVEGTKRHRGHRNLIKLSQTCIISNSACYFHPSSHTRSISVTSVSSSSLSFCFPRLGGLTSAGRSESSQDLTKRRKLKSQTLTGCTACQPCSRGAAERFCTPFPPPLSCPGSSVRSPSFPRLRKTYVRVSK